MMNDFLDNLGAQQHEKMIEKNASKEEYYNSQSEVSFEEPNFNSPAPSVAADVASSVTFDLKEELNNLSISASTGKTFYIEATPDADKHDYFNDLI